MTAARVVFPQSTGRTARWNRPILAWWLALSLFASPARADDYSWNNASGGNWNVDTNWNPIGPPVAADNATINLAGTYTVILNDNRAITNLTIDNSTATLSHTAGTFTVGGTIALNAGAYSLTGGTISGGSITSAGGLLRLGNNNNNRFVNVAIGTGVLDFTTAGARVRLQGTSTLAAGTTVNMAVSNTFLAFEQTVTLSDLTVNLSASAAISVDGNNTVTIAPTTTITAGAGGAQIQEGTFSNGNSVMLNQGLIRNTGAGTLTIDPDTFTNQSGGIIRATAGSINITSPSFTNQSGGLVHATGNVTIASGGVINQAGGAFTVDGGIMNLNGGWSNAGTIDLSSGTLNLGGSFTLADIGTVNRTGGIVQITGSMSNTGTTLALNATTGSYRLAGGTITGGDITVAGGALLELQNSNNNRLNNVAVGLNALDFSSTGARVRLQGTSTLAAGTTVNMTLANTFLAFEQTTTLNDLTINLSGGGAISVDGNNTVTIAPTTTITAGAGGGQVREEAFVSGNSAMLNQGLIQNTASGTLLINPDTFTNQSGGIIRATAGSINITSPSFTNQSGGLVHATGNVTIASGGVINQSGGAFTVDGGVMSLNGAGWRNEGSIDLSSGTLNLGGSFALADIGAVNRTGGIVQVTGSLNNTGTALALNGTTGSYRLNGGTITGGDITVADGALLELQNSNNNRLNNVAVGLGVLDFSASGARVRLQGTTTLAAGSTMTLAATNSFLSFEQTATVNDLTINITSASDVSVEGNNTLTLGPNATITHTSGGGAMIRDAAFVGGNTAVVNQSLIRNTGTGTLTISPDNFTNDSSGTLRVSTGAIAIANATNLTNYAGDTLTGGTWEIHNTATLNLNTRPIATLAAGTTVLFNGANPTFAALNNLTANNGTLRILGGKTFTPTAASVTNAGVIEVGEGSTFGKGIVIASGGQLLGAGTVSGAVVAESGGMVAPGASPGTLTFSGNLTLQAGSTLSIELNGPTAGSEYDQVVVGGDVDVTGATLSLSLGYVPSLTDQLFILVNGSANPITGEFAGLPDGTRITLGEYFADISYFGDSVGLTTTGGNDLVLHNFHPVPEPGPMIAIAAVGLVAVGGWRRWVSVQHHVKELSPPC